MSLFILTLISRSHKLKKTTLYYFLVGKKTSSTLIFGYFHELLPYFGLGKNLTKMQYDRLVADLIHQGEISEKEGFLFGRKEATLDLKKEFPFLKAYPYGSFAQELWQLFLFALQVLSQRSYKKKDYLPLSDEFLTGLKIKTWLKKEHLYGENIQVVKEEISRLFQSLPEKIAEDLSREWHGYQLTGEIPPQIYDFQHFSGQLTYENHLHAFLETLEVGNYPLLKSLLVFPQTSLTLTEEMMEKVADFSQLLALRPTLKASTLRDHLLELAVRNPENFPFFKFQEDQTLTFLKNYQGKQPDFLQWEFKQLNQLEKLDFLTYRLYQIQTLWERRSHGTD